MPEGHIVHRLASIFRAGFVGQPLLVSSPQGRFAPGAALVNGWQLVGARAHGKQMFLEFAPPTDARPGSDAVEHRFIRIHLGMYGAWTFTAAPGTALPDLHDGGKVRVGERGFTGHADAEELAGGAGVSGSGSGSAAGAGRWDPPEPTGAVRVRLISADACADLAGPTACEVITAAEVEEVLARLGPDPLDNLDDAVAHDQARAQFVANVRSRKRAVGQILMDQSQVAGIGNIYRCELLFRHRIDPYRRGVNISAAKLRALWDDLTELMIDGRDRGKIITAEAADVPGGDTEEHRFYVYHRTGQPCRRCGASIREALMENRRLFWCPKCQRKRPAKE